MHVNVGNTTNQLQILMHIVKNNRLAIACDKIMMKARLHVR